LSAHPQDLSLREQARAIDAGELDATELLEATLARIAERNPPLNAIVDQFASESAAMLAEAPDGPLHGVPVAIKDQFALPWRAPRDGAYANPFGIGPGESGLFRRLREAGAVVVGVTNMHEFGLGTTGHLSAYGPVGNPWDPSRVGGGSSGGSGSAVAARMVAGAVGTDGGGSVRIPSGYCGATGLKLTWGQIPVDGFTHGHLTYGTAGPICRDAADARLLGEAMLSRPLEAASASGLRIGIPSAQWSDLDPEVEKACGDAIELLRGAGLETREVAIAGSEHAAIATGVPVGMESIPAAKPELAAEIAPHLSLLIRALMKYQLLTPGGVIFKIERVRTKIRRSVAELFEQVDVLAWPCTPAPAPLIENPSVTLPSGDYPADFANLPLCGIANITGVPAGSIPCGHSAAGLPIALQLLAPWGDDARVLDLAELFEQLSDRRYVEAVPPIAATTPA
jgi:aspartyl-tRNA(Asn)/glutamyl-tRNA(Gln) amidotransferase subunit A